MSGVKIALIGDFHPEVIAHRAIPVALKISAQKLGVEVEPEWVPTDSIRIEELARYSGLWCVPGSPYASTDGALCAIRFARLAPRPFLGTCGGFQHAMLEYARNVLGHVEVAHEEMEPEAGKLLLSRLSCSLVEKGGSVNLKSSSRLATIYSVERIEEMYHCNYGLNPQCSGWFDDPAGLHIAGADDAGEVRAVELSDHPFFIATLFQPERSGFRDAEHPLITAFLNAAVTHRSAAIV